MAARRLSTKKRMLAPDSPDLHLTDESFKNEIHKGPIASGSPCEFDLRLPDQDDSSHELNLSRTRIVVSRDFVAGTHEKGYRSNL